MLGYRKLLTSRAGGGVGIPELSLKQLTRWDEAASVVDGGSVVA